MSVLESSVADRPHPAPGGEVSHLPSANLTFDDEASVASALAELLPRVRTWLFRLLGPTASLDDAVQDCLIELARALPRFRGDSALATYAHRIALRVGYRHIRRRSREREVPLSLVPPIEGGIDPETQVAQREILARLYRCLDRLSQKRRTAFVLCAIEGLSPGQAAEVLGVASTAVRSRLKHARREVDRMLDDDPFLMELRLEEAHR